MLAIKNPRERGWRLATLCDVCSITLVGGEVHYISDGSTSLEVGRLKRHVDT
jgi:hypothetical protein